MDILVILDVIGIMAFALAGFSTAIGEKLDLLGIVFITYLTAFGGGLIRDLILDREPFIFTTSYPMMIVLVVIIVSIFFGVQRINSALNTKIFQLSDAVGLAAFSFTGASLAYAHGFNLGGVIFLGLLPAIGGGLLRDIVLNKSPEILISDFYGSIAILTAIQVYLVSIFLTMTPLAIAIILANGFFLRIFAIKYKWHLPALN